MASEGEDCRQEQKVQPLRFTGFYTRVFLRNWTNQRSLPNEKESFSWALSKKGGGGVTKIQKF